MAATYELRSPHWKPRSHRGSDVAGVRREADQAGVGRLRCTADGHLLVGVGANKPAFVWNLTDDALSGSFTFLAHGAVPGRLRQYRAFSGTRALRMVPMTSRGIRSLLPYAAPTWRDSSRNTAADCLRSGWRTPRCGSGATPEESIRPKTRLASRPACGKGVRPPMKPPAASLLTSSVPVPR